MALADDIKTQIDAWVAANDEASLLRFGQELKFWIRPSTEKARGIVHADLDQLQLDRKAAVVALASQALADSLETQINAWVAANDEAALLKMMNITRHWVAPSTEKARGIVHADLDTLQATCKADLDTLLAP